MTPNRRFQLANKEFSLGTTDDDVKPIQNYLRTFGYLYAPFSYGVFDISTSEALGLFQKNFGLPITGEVSHHTVLAMEAYRCGVPDIDRGIPEFGKFAELIGCSYSNRVNMTYRFDTITRDLPTDSVREAVRNAFSTWSRVVPITFREVATDQAADFRIGWFTGNHGDGSPFDGAGDATGNVLAHAFYPPNCGGANAGLMHFDDFETWAVAASGTAMDLETVALHEIGHLLGLAHSDVNGSVMFPTIRIGETNRILTADDIAGIQRLYGTRAFNRRNLQH